MYPNPMIWADFPDLDVIRVEDTYYMVSTTMHMMPGCVILRSYDLIHWEVASYVYDVLDNTPAQRLEDGQHIYGQGMWAPTLRYHKGKFYVIFVANDTRRTYLYTADSVSGPWAKQYIEGFYHDCSLLFDDDGRTYLIYGNAEIHLTELKEDLSGPKPGGLNRIIVKESEPYHLGYEGAHFYKIDGRYYAFFIHISKAAGRRTQACFAADSRKGSLRAERSLTTTWGILIRALRREASWIRRTGNGWPCCFRIMAPSAGFRCSFRCVLRTVFRYSPRKRLK
ncbi:glycoside hydrolase 43 family protein [Paenibacillus sp. JTLBN-2024]